MKLTTNIKQISPSQRFIPAPAHLGTLEVFRLPTMGSRCLLTVLAILGSFLAGAHQGVAQDWTPTGAPTNSWKSIATSADGTKLVATGSGVDFIYASTNSGTNWNLTGAPLGPWFSLASSADGTKLLAVGSDYLIITNGNNIYTLATAARVYTSTNAGTSWTRAGDTPTNVIWTSAASSAGGQKLVVGTTSGAIYTSTNAGGSWTLHGVPNQQWSSIASSADGTKLVAVTVKGGIYTSADSGDTWTRTSAPTNLWWWSVGSSADGMKLVAVAKYDAQAVAGVPIYVSKDAGTNWVMTDSPSNHWNSVASSADGTKLVAAAAWPSTSIWISRDSGDSWTTPNGPSGYWTCVASSADGNRLFAGMSFGGIYSSQWPAVDTVPPVIVEASASSTTLWPPNHQMIPIELRAQVEDDSGEAQWGVVAIDCNEACPDSDMQIEDDHRVSLRAVRSGQGHGRIYTIWLQAVDAAENLSQPFPVTVSVPHDQGRKVR